MPVNLNNATLGRVATAAPVESKGPRVRAGGTLYRKIPFAKLPEVMAEIASSQIAGLRALTRQGVQLDLEEIEKLAKLATLVNALSSAHTRLVKPSEQADPEKMSTAELERLAGK